MRLLRVSSPYFVAGLVIEDGKIIKAAPIIKYSKGKVLDQILKYFKSKGWTVEECKI